MYPAADLNKLNTLCLSCHYGNNDKFTTHKIMGAGHPRLSFELDTFLALQPPHYQIDKDYKKRKTVYDASKRWALGQIALAKAQLELLQGSYIQQSPLFPELALFDCYACHNNSMRQLNWKRRISTAHSEPGSVPINDAHLRMLVVITKQIDDKVAKQILVLCQALQRAVSESPKKLLSISQQLSAIIDPISNTLTTTSFSKSDKIQILSNLIDMGIKGEYRDYIGAEQVIMAIELITIDLGKDGQYQSHLDELFRLLKKDEDYQSAQFTKALARFKADF